MSVRQKVAPWNQYIEKCIYQIYSKGGFLANYLSSYFKILENICKLSL